MKSENTSHVNCWQIPESVEPIPTTYKVTKSCQTINLKTGFGKKILKKLLTKPFKISILRLFWDPRKGHCIRHKYKLHTF